MFKLDKAESLMPEVAIGKLAERYPTGKQHRGNVALFTGCISDHFDRKTLLASIKLLNAIGFDVLVPNEQTCCGAIHQHQGNTAVAGKMAALNTDVFNSLDIDAIIYTASGCGLMLNEYEQDNGDEAGDTTEIRQQLIRYYRVPESALAGGPRPERAPCQSEEGRRA